MSKNLTIAIIQPALSSDTAEDLRNFQSAVERVMAGYRKPELIIGVEHGLGRQLDTVPGTITGFMSALARKHGVYLIPGTMSESAPELPEGAFYNTCPIFAPDGSMIDRYRKKVPFKPGEPSEPSGDGHYCVFEIKEKGIKVGVQVCYDQFFPEISRTLALMGAELIVCPALDTMEFNHIPDIIPRARALENEAFYIWTNSVGSSVSGTCCGRSVIVNPEGDVVYQCGGEPMTVVETLNFDEVLWKRVYGRDQHLNSLRHFQIPYPFAGKLDQAPVYQGIPGLTYTPGDYEERIKELDGGRFHGVDEAEAHKLDEEMETLLHHFS